MKELAIASVALIIGFSLNLIADWWKLRRDDNRQYKELLYYLLEVYHKTGNMNIRMSKALEMIGSKLVDAPDHEKNELLTKFYIGTSRIIINQIKIDLAEIHERLQKSVELISKTNPFDAYYLSGLAQRIDRTDSMFKNLDFNSFAITESEIKAMQDFVANVLEPEAFREVGEIANKYILKLSKKLKYNKEAIEFFSKITDHKIEDVNIEDVKEFLSSLKK